MAKTAPPAKPCPTCYAPMRSTKNGFECERHGAPARKEQVVHALRDSREVVPRRVAATRSVRPRTAKTPVPPREPNQTDRLTERRDEIIARNRAGESIAAIAADLWQELGYKSAHVCASKISHFLTRRGLRAAERRPGPPPGAGAAQRFSHERLGELRSALDVGESVWSFAGSHWEDWGFTSRSSCDSLLRKWLRTKAISA